jgi:hypothetical protein
MLCSARLGFGQTTGADTHTAHAYKFTDDCPACKHHPQYSDGRPVDALGAMMICPNCAAVYRWYESYTFDLSALFCELRRSHGWDTARQICNGQAETWGRAIGALQDYIPEGHPC